MNDEKEKNGTQEAGEEPGEQAPQDGSERRRHPRVKAKMHMVFEDGRTAVKTRVVDISLGGVFLEMEKPPEAGTEIRLTPILPDQPSDHKPQPIKGRVVRVVEYDLENFPQPRGGIGVEFSDVSDNEQSSLSSIFREGIKDLQDEDDEDDEDDAARTGEWSGVARRAAREDPDEGN